MFVAGASDSSSFGTNHDYLTIKYSNTGVALWTNRYNGPGNGADGAHAVAVDSSGNVFVTGDLGVGGDITLANADCAEDFDLEVEVEPGAVVVLTDSGALRGCTRAFDTRVVGVVSGAGDFRPGIVLDKKRSSRLRQPVALMGKVFCKVDAQFGAIEVGDLLTTSPTPGHAMKTSDPLKAFGAVIGKALRPLTEGQGLIPILIALQ